MKRVYRFEEGEGGHSSFILSTYFCIFSRSSYDFSPLHKSTKNSIYIYSSILGESKTPLSRLEAERNEELISFGGLMPDESRQRVSAARWIINIGAILQRWGINCIMHDAGKGGRGRREIDLQNSFGVIVMEYVI